jgi:regulator of sigma E protease
MAAGAIMNLLTAVLLFAIIGVIGQPLRIGAVTITQVVPGAPADGKLQRGDVILKVDGQPVDSQRTLKSLVDERLGREVTLDVQSTKAGGVTDLKQVKLRPRTEAERRSITEGALGVGIDVPNDQLREVRYVDRLNPLAAVVYGVERTVTFLVQMIAGLGTLLGSLFGLARAPQGGLAGPVGIARLTGEIAQRGGLLPLLEWTGVLSVNLALINLLPLPALDGSRIVFALIEWVRGGKKVPPEREAMVHAVGMMLLLGLTLVVTFTDVRNWIGGRDTFGG